MTHDDILSAKRATIALSEIANGIKDKNTRLKLLLDIKALINVVRAAEATLAPVITEAKP